MFKKIAIMSLVTSTLFASSVKWHTVNNMKYDFDNKKIKVPIILFIGTYSCLSCDSLKLAMNYDNDYSDFVNKNFYNVYVNKDKINIPKKFISDNPLALYILNPENLKSITPKPKVDNLEIKSVFSYMKSIKKAYDLYLNKI